MGKVNLFKFREYINFEQLAEIINEKDKILSENFNNDNENSLDENNVSILTPALSPLLELDQIDRFISKNNFKYLKKFINAVDQELKRIYLFYNKIEREIYESINSQLHKMKNNKLKFPVKPSQINNFNEIKKKINSLIKIGNKNIDIINFVDLNITGIKTIFTIFDKHFSLENNQISMKFFYDRLEKNNSYLSYLFEFKIIDEISAIFEELFKIYHTKLLILKRQCYSTNLINDRLSNLNNDSLILKNESTRNIVYEHINEVEQLFLNLREIMKKIDQLCLNFSKKLKSWKIIVNHDVCILYSYSIKNEINNKNSDKGKYALRHYSDLNITNILLFLIYSSFYFAFYCLIFPNLNGYLKEELKSQNKFSGFIISATHLGEVIGKIINLLWVQTSYQYPLIFSGLMLFFSQFMYCYSYLLNSILMIGLSRFLLGLGNAEILNKKYLTEYVNKIDITKYSMLNTYFSLIGSCIGFSITLVFIIINNKYTILNYIKFDSYTYPSTIGLLGSFFLLISILCFYKDPNSVDFEIYERDCIIFLKSDCSNDGSVFENSISSWKETTSNNKFKEDIEFSSEIRRKLENLNQNYIDSNTNLVSKIIDELKLRENMICSNTNKCFTFLLIVILISKIFIESLFIIFPIHIQSEISNTNTINHNEIVTAIIQLSATFLIIPSYYLTSKLVDCFNEKIIIFFLLMFTIISSFLMINIFYPSIIKYFLGYILSITFCTLLENISYDLLIKVSFVDFKTGISKTVKWYNLASFLGKLIGSSLISILGILCQEKYINDILISFVFSCFLIIFIVFVFCYGEIRIKAISRILRKS